MKHHLFLGSTLCVSESLVLGLVMEIIIVFLRCSIYFTSIWYSELQWRIFLFSVIIAFSNPPIVNTAHLYAVYGCHHQPPSSFNMNQRGGVTLTLIFFSATNSNTKLCPKPKWMFLLFFAKFCYNTHLYHNQKLGRPKVSVYHQYGSWR